MKRHLTMRVLTLIAFSGSLITRTKELLKIFRLCNLLILVMLILLVFSCGTTRKLTKNSNSNGKAKYKQIEKYQTPWEAKLKNTKTVSFKKGKIEGLTEGEEIGFEKGKQLGIEEGEKIGSEKAEKELEECRSWFKALENTNENNCGALVEKVRQIAIKQGLDQGYRKGFDEGFIEGKRKGYKEGYEIGYRNGYQEQLSLIISRKKNQIKLVDYEFQSALDYEWIISEISKINGSEENDLRIYTSVLNEVHKEILEFVSVKLSLNSEEKHDLFYEYNRIHEQITKSYYQQFRDLYYARNVADQNSVEYFTEYNNVDIFNEVLTSGICMLVDIGVSYATANPLYGAAAGLLLGELCEILVTNVIGVISDDMFKISLFREYNKLELELEEQSVKMIGELAVTEFERVEKGTKKRAIIILGFPISDASVKVKLRTVLKLGFDLAEFDIRINHKKQEFIISLSDEPKVLSITQVPKFISIDTGFLINIDESDLNEIYQKAEKNAIKEAMKEGIGEAAKTKAENILKTIFYPVIALPHSQYKVIVKFGKGKGHNLFTSTK